jgi:hypothetical protein
MGIWITSVDPKVVDGAWKVVHQSDCRSHLHNHRAASDIVLPGTRRRVRTEKIAAAIQQQVAASVDVARTLASLQAGSLDLPITRRDLHNERARVKRQALKTLTPLEALFETLDGEGYFYRYQLDTDGHIRDILMVNPLSIKLLRGNSNLLLFDCTYKTNRYNRPALNICAITGLNTSIQAGIVLMQEEKETDYTWALTTFGEMLKEKDIDPPTVIITDREEALMNAVEAVFPAADSLLCRWHQNKDVIAFCRKYIKEQILDPEGDINPNGRPKKVDHPDTKAFLDIYNKCIGAKTQEAFRSACEEAKQANWRCAEYLAREWWPWKEMCVAYWTNQITHYGLQTTSTPEGMHALMKKWLTDSRSDLCTSLQKLIPWWHQLLTEAIYSTEAEKIAIPYSLSGKTFSRTVRVIHRFPLLKTADLLVEARQRLSLIKNGKEERTICHNSFRTAHGRPCVHELMDIIESDGILSPHRYHQHWWIDKEKAPTHARKRVLDTRGRSQENRTGTGENETRREPLDAGWVDRSHPTTAPLPSITPPHVRQELIAPRLPSRVYDQSWHGISRQEERYQENQPPPKLLYPHPPLQNPPLPMVQQNVLYPNPIPTPMVTQQGRLSTTVSAQPFVPAIQPQQQIYPREWYQQQHPSFESRPPAAAPSAATRGAILSSLEAP